MSGQILSNKQADELVKSGVIKLTPNYDLSKFQIAQYPLYPKIIWQLDQSLRPMEIFKFDNKNGSSFKLAPKSYYLISIEEDILLPKGIIGRFILPSNLIERGISLSYGKIEYPFGQNKEKVRFGVYNCLDFETSLEKDTRIAYIEFFDLRGPDLLDYTLNSSDQQIYNDRIYHDWDGPNYELADDEDN